MASGGISATSGAASIVVRRRPSGVSPPNVSPISLI